MSEHESHEPVLSQDEIHALIKGVESGEVESANEYGLHDGVVRAVDFSARERLMGGRLPGLETIGSRFIQSLRQGVCDLLRSHVDASFGGMRVIRFEEYAQSLARPTSTNPLRLPPLNGTGAFVVHAGLVGALVDRYFGGDGRFQMSIEERSFTPLEARVIQLMLDRAQTGLEEAWAPAMPVTVEFAGSDGADELESLMAADEVAMVMSFALETDGAGGELHLVLPYSMLEPIREHLDAGATRDRTGHDARWPLSIKSEMQVAQVEVHATLLDTTVSLGRLLALKAGDVLPVELPETVVLCAENVPMFRARVGVSEGVNAVEILGRLDPGTNAANAAGTAPAARKTPQPRTDG